MHLEGDGKDKSGKPITYVIDGKIENLGLPHRSIVGTWKSQTENGAFKIAHDSKRKRGRESFSRAAQKDSRPLFRAYRFSSFSAFLR